LERQRKRAWCLVKEIVMAVAKHQPAF
jgi:hypothetical protein